MTRKKPLLDKCSYCDTPMKKGYLRCLGSLWGWDWVKEKKPWTRGTCIAEAYTCQNCKIILLSSDLKDLGLSEKGQSLTD